MNAAIEIIARDGFKQASTKEIAKIAECTEALIFKYFKIKEDILDAIIKKVMGENDSEMALFLNQSYDFKTFLSELLNWYMKNYTLKTNIYKVIVRHEAANIEFGNFVYQQRLTRRLKPIILECEKRKKNGEIKSHVNCEMLGLIILELLDSIKFKILFLELDKDKVQKEYKKMFFLLAENFT